MEETEIDKINSNKMEAIEVDKTDSDKMMEKEVDKANNSKIKINMTKEALFNYMMINSRKGLGLFVWGISIFALVLLPYSIYIMDLRLIAVFGILVYLNLITKPLQFRASAANQLLNNEIFQHPISYEFSEKGVLMKQISGEALLPWSDFLSVKNKKKLLLLYVSKEQAFIIIKNQVTEDKLKEIQSVIGSVAGLKHNL